jgi:hypothetical protein
MGSLSVKPSRAVRRPTQSLPHGGLSHMTCVMVVRMGEVDEARFSALAADVDRKAAVRSVGTLGARG